MSASVSGTEKHATRTVGAEGAQGRTLTPSTPIPEARAALPTREAAFEAFCTLLAYVTGGNAGPSVYSADALPTGVTRRAFLDRHRARVAAGAEGWARAGHARTVTVAAWDLDVAQETARRRRVCAAPPTSAPSNDTGDALDAALGIRTRRTAR